MSYWQDVDPPMSFVPEAWTYAQKRQFRYTTLDYLLDAVKFECFEGKRVLCIGDGGGIDAVEFARSGARVSVLDMSAKAVALTRKHFAEAGQSLVQGVVGDVRAMPLASDAYDIVYAFGVLHHIPEVDDALSEISRVLVPGGCLLGMVYHRESLLYAYSILLRAQKEGLTADEAMRAYSERNPGCPHSVAYTRREVLLLFDRAGFSYAGVTAHYDVIDLPDKRKVPVLVDGGDVNLGWHLFFEAIK